MALEGEYAAEKTPWVADQLAKIDETGTTDSVDIMGLPVVVFTIRGRKSGKLRRVPLMKVERDGAYALVGSKGGAAEHPAWYHNVKAHPEVEVQDGADRFTGTARELSSEERAHWWERSVQAFPQYAEYQKNTDREIPVLVVEKTS